jgi:hypothetical protein
MMHYARGLAEETARGLEPGTLQEAEHRAVILLNSACLFGDPAPLELAKIVGDFAAQSLKLKDDIR